MADFTTADLDALAALEAGATPGPWSSVRTEPCCVIPHEEHHDLYAGPPGGTGDNVACHTANAADAACIVATRNALPALIAEVRARRAGIADDRQRFVEAVLLAAKRVVDAKVAFAQAIEDGGEWLAHHKDLSDADDALALAVGALRALDARGGGR